MEIIENSMSSVNLNVAARSGRPGQCECLLQGADFTALSNSNKIAKETIGAEVVWKITTHSESGKPTKFQDGTESEKAKSCSAMSPYKPTVLHPEPTVERNFGVEMLGEDNWRFNTWDDFCLNINKTCCLTKKAFYSVLLFVAAGGQCCLKYWHC